MLCKSQAVGMCCISKIIKDRTLQLIANKNDRGYHIQRIDLGKSIKVKAVLKL